jgi:hypothetical protein
VLGHIRSFAGAHLRHFERVTVNPASSPTFYESRQDERADESSLVPGGVEPISGWQHAQPRVWWLHPSGCTDLGLPGRPGFSPGSRGRRPLARGFLWGRVARLRRGSGGGSPGDCSHLWLNPSWDEDPPVHGSKRHPGHGRSPGKPRRYTAVNDTRARPLTWQAPPVHGSERHPATAPLTAQRNPNAPATTPASARDPPRTTAPVRRGRRPPSADGGNHSEPPRVSGRPSAAGRKRGRVPGGGRWRPRTPE